jgi:DNA-binding LytR/AlgR family response regulator
MGNNPIMKKVLIIEDEKQLLQNIAKLLKYENFAVETASSGKEGITLALQSKPDLIICDIMMPGMDGYEVIKELAKNYSTSTIPFIFLTAKVDRSDLRKGMELGADDYITKPFNSDDLIKAVKTRINKFEMFKAVIQDDKQNLGDDKINRYKPDDNIYFQMHSSSFLVKVEKIKYISADNQYTIVNFDNEKHIVIRRSISKWEQLLPEKLFIRIHRSTLINSQFISKIEKSVSNTYKVILMNTDKNFDISRKYLKKLKNFS